MLNHAGSSKPKQRPLGHRLWLLLPLIILLNLGFQWNSGRLYINPWPPFTFLPLDDQGNGYYSEMNGPNRVRIGDREYRLDSINGGATTGWQTAVSRCGGFLCQTVLASRYVISAPGEFGRDRKNHYFVVEGGAAVLNLASPWMTRETFEFPSRYHNAKPGELLRNMVFFDGKHPPLVIRGAALPGETRRSIADIVQEACVYQSIRYCPVSAP